MGIFEFFAIVFAVGGVEALSKSFDITERI
ncbi:hypothetical protein CP8484711_1279A, partial [Chlamydia psittaci 84-8471/1]